VPPALSAKDLPGGQTQVLDVRQVIQVECHPAESNDDCAPGSIVDTEHSLHWIGDLDNPNNIKDNREVDNESIQSSTMVSGLQKPKSLGM
jgi:hypothetical protein